MEGFNFVTPLTGLNRPNTGKEDDDDDDDEVIMRHITDNTHASHKTLSRAASI
jgi:hypothetical protein